MGASAFEPRAFLRKRTQGLGPQPSSRPSSEGPPFGSDLSLRTRTFFETPRPPPFVGVTKPMVQQFCGDSCLINQKNEKKRKKAELGQMYCMICKLNVPLVVRICFAR